MRLVASSIKAINCNCGPRSSSHRNGDVSIITNSPNPTRRSRHTCTARSLFRRARHNSASIIHFRSVSRLAPGPCPANFSAAKVGPKSTCADAPRPESVPAPRPESSGSKADPAADVPTLDLLPPSPASPAATLVAGSASAGGFPPPDSRGLARSHAAPSTALALVHSRRSALHGPSCPL
jgi:hypothetical protein